MPGIPTPADPPGLPGEDDDGEAMRVHEWRMERLADLGFDYVQALELVMAGVDWHTAGGMLAKGMSHEQAVGVLA